MPGAGDISEHLTVQKCTACLNRGLPYSPLAPAAPSQPMNHFSVLSTSLVCACAKTQARSCTHACTHTVPEAVHTCKSQPDPESWSSWSCFCPWAGPSVPPTRSQRFPEASSSAPFSAGRLNFQMEFHKEASFGVRALESAQGLGWFGERGQGCSPERGRTFPWGHQPSLCRSLPPCPGLLASSHLLPALRGSKQHSGPGRAGSGPRWARRVSLVP